VLTENWPELDCTTECSYLTNSQTTSLFSQILFYATIPGAFQVAFEVKGVTMGTTMLPLNLIDICDDNGNTVVSVYMSSARVLRVNFMGNEYTDGNNGPEIISNFTTEWTTVAVSLRNGLLSFWTVADVESAMFLYDVSTITGWLSCDLCQFYSSGQSDTGASGYIRNIHIAGAGFPSTSSFSICVVILHYDDLILLQAIHFRP
jgi:hypothetical protein